jgi:hypothetical protein
MSSKIKFRISSDNQEKVSHIEDFSPPKDILGGAKLCDILKIHKKSKIKGWIILIFILLA